MIPETHITNLLYRYAELMDAGELEAVAALFAKARVKMSGGRWKAPRRCWNNGAPSCASIRAAPRAPST
jgi:hypothetical protein